MHTRGRRSLVGRRATRYAGAAAQRPRSAGVGLSVQNVRAEGLAASRGATDFGEYFAYFSFFLVVSALHAGGAVLPARRRAARARGRAAARRRLHARRAVRRSVRRRRPCAGTRRQSSSALAGAIVYGALMMAGLRHLVGRCGRHHRAAAPCVAVSLLLGAVGGMVAAMACIWWTLRRPRTGVGAVAPRRPDCVGRTRAGPHRPADAGRVGSRLSRSWESRCWRPERSGGSLEPAHFSARARCCWPRACLPRLVSCARRRARRSPVRDGGRSSRLGLRNATYRPGRSVLSIAVIASATFILISVDAFRRPRQPPAIRTRAPAAMR